MSGRVVDADRSPRSLMTPEQTRAWIALASAMEWPPAALDAQLRRDADLSVEVS